MYVGERVEKGWFLLLLILNGKSSCQCEHSEIVNYQIMGKKFVGGNDECISCNLSEKRSPHQTPRWCETHIAQGTLPPA